MNGETGTGPDWCSMMSMAQTTVPRRRGWTWYAAGVAVLAVGTGIAAAMLLSRNISLGSDVWFDPQDHPQRVASWRGAAILAYTSGSEVGHAFAVPAGLLIAHAVAAVPWRVGLGVASSAGAVLALVNLPLAWWLASPQLTRRARQTGSIDQGAVDPGLWHHKPVIVAIVLVVAAYLVFAILGYALGRMRLFGTAIVIMAVLGVTAPYSHFFLAEFLTPRPVY